MSYSKDLRQRVIKFVKEGGTRQQASAQFSVSLRTVYYWLNESTPQKCGPKKPHKIDMLALRENLETQPDAYLSERAEHFNVTPRAIFYALKRLGVTKKNVDV